MKIAYFRCDQKMVRLLDLAVRSLQQCSPDVLIFIVHNDLPSEQIDYFEDLGTAPFAIQPLGISSEDWVTKMFWTKPASYCRLKPHKDGDLSLLLDVDMLFVDDPFTCFEKEFDVAFTLRNRDKRFGPTNGGLAAVRGSEVSSRFVKFWADQALDPTWLPAKKWREDILPQRDGDVRAETCDQYVAFACHSHLNQLPAEAKAEIAFLPSVYNWILPKGWEKARREAVTSGAKVLHFKHDAKVVMERMAREFFELKSDLKEEIDG